MKNKFNETFPDINLDDLQKQNMNIIIQDGNTYSYGFNKWTLNMYGNRLDKILFE